MNNLENIPACLRVIARQIEKGEIEADLGVLSLRKKGVARPVVFGFGPGRLLDPVSECGRAVGEYLRLTSTEPLPKITKEMTLRACEALSNILAESR
jgi:hypothetical protein